MEAELSHAAETCVPRVCDCDFCVKHGAAYVSDPQGALRFTIERTSALSNYRQGSGTAEFLVCEHCGVLTGVLFRSESGIFGALNARAIDPQVSFGTAQSASPKKLAREEKVARWQSLWFPKVEVIERSA